MTTTLARLRGLVIASRLYEAAYGIRLAELGEQDITCDTCGATWVGYRNDPCDWCARHLELMLEGQRELLLTPPDGDPHDNAYAEMAIEWAKRLRRGVESGLVTRHEADAVLARVDVDEQEA